MAGLLGALADPQFRADVGQGLLGALNRGAVGGLLGSPVDMATMALRPFGYRVEKPVGGSEWIGDQMQRAGIVGPQRNAVAEGLASVAVPAAMTRAAPAVFAAEQAIPKAVEKYGMAAERALDPVVTRGLERGGLTREMLLAMGNKVESPITVYHGSPHKFDKFDSSKIGTGEGAQAYGHGLYLAESPDVAQSYQQFLGGTKPTYRLGASEIDRSSLNEIDKLALNIAARPKEYTIKALEDTGLPPSVINRVKRAAKRFAGASYEDVAQGSLYKVDLPDSAVARMLDWDKPLSQQDRAVLESLTAFKPWGTTSADDLAKLEVTGEHMWKRYIAQKMGGPVLPGKAATGAADVAQQLRAAGIPGIRYLDGGSRGAGAGTSNFVIFPGEESLLTILERNGMPLPK